MELSSELIGTFGCMIGNSALRRVCGRMSSSGSRRKAQDLLSDLLVLHLCALDGGARAIVREDERDREPDHANEFKLAVQLYDAKEITPSSGSRGGGKRDSAGGLVANVDRISIAEDKLRRPRARHAVRRVR